MFKNVKIKSVIARPEGQQNSRMSSRDFHFKKHRSKKPLAKSNYWLLIHYRL